jgi:hypothetical protein
MKRFAWLENKGGRAEVGGQVWSVGASQQERVAAQIKEDQIGTLLQNDLEAQAFCVKAYAFRQFSDVQSSFGFGGQWGHPFFCLF